jgi:hypothetical protein
MSEIVQSSKNAPKPTLSSSAPSFVPTTTTTTTTTTNNTSANLNPKAAEWKPNPKAAEWKPSVFSHLKNTNNIFLSMIIYILI